MMAVSFAAYEGNDRVSMSQSRIAEVVRTPERKWSERSRRAVSIAAAVNAAAIQQRNRRSRAFAARRKTK